MNVTLVQLELHWEDRDANLKMLDELIQSLERTDLIVLPEMFNTAFSNNSRSLSETMDGHTLSRMKEWAAAKKAVVTGSIMIKEDGHHYNRMLWVRPDGKVEYYDKRHLFRMASEHDHFTAGQKRMILEWKGWRVLLQVCYDLRFPVYARNRYNDGAYEYDLVLYVANWPSPRHSAWQGLLRARAIENLAYCAGVNRIGKDGNGLEYRGGSVLLDYLGNPLAEAGQDKEVLRSEIKKEALLQFREKFPTGMDADSFTLLA